MTILVVDDDPQIGDLLSDYLVKHGYRVRTARDATEMARVMKEVSVNLVVLDIMLPGEDGLSICRRLRAEADVFIIMLSAVGEEADRVVGLEVGADDYLPKPFSPRELLARIKAVVRRHAAAEGAAVKRLAALPTISFMDWSLDQNKQRLLAPDGAIVPLTRGEYELLLAFLEHPKRTLTRDQLLDLTRGRQGEPFERTVDVQVGRLRKKIEEDPKNPEILVTVRGGGYMLTADVSVAGSD